MFCAYTYIFLSSLMNGFCFSPILALLFTLVLQILLILQRLLETLSLMAVLMIAFSHVQQSRITARSEDVGNVREVFAFEVASLEAPIVTVNLFEPPETGYHF